MSKTCVSSWALSWSGGKDCTQALARLQADPAIEVAALVATLGETAERVSMHGIRETQLEEQAAALDLPLVKIWLPEKANNETYRERFAEALQPLRASGLEGVAFGDIALVDVRDFRVAQMQALELQARFPLWRESTAALAETFMASGYRAILTCVDAEQLDPTFLGREFDAQLLADLPEGIDPCGENGEFHSFVYAGPPFSRRLEFARGREHVSFGRFHFLDLEPV
jgi:uncharacterized protein (TIGR00290 family)